MSATTTTHRHRFYRWTIRGLPVGRWRCSCGIKLVNPRDVARMEGLG